LAFNVHENVFEKIKLSVSWSLSSMYCKMVPISYRGSLAIVYYPKNGMCHSIWIMNDMNLWENKIRIEIASGVLWNVPSFKKNGYIILETSRNLIDATDLCSYDLESQEVTRLGIRGRSTIFVLTFTWRALPYST
jgi:hypothetical protein